MKNPIAVAVKTIEGNFSLVHFSMVLTSVQCSYHAYVGGHDGSFRNILPVLSAYESLHP